MITRFRCTSVLYEVYTDAILKGKHILVDIYEFITRFHSGKYAIVGDIKKICLQIKISKEDQMYHGVVYEGETYVFTRVCLGNESSHLIAEQSMIKIAEAGSNSHPNTSMVLLHKRYMDDLIDAENDESNLMDTRYQVDNILGKFGFEIKEWFSNNSKLGTVLDQTKVLGLKWNISKDML